MFDHLGISPVHFFPFSHQYECVFVRSILHLNFFFKVRDICPVSIESADWGDNYSFHVETNTIPGNLLTWKQYSVLFRFFPPKLLSGWFFILPCFHFPPFFTGSNFDPQGRLIWNKAEKSEEVKQQWYLLGQRGECLPQPPSEAKKYA